MILYSNGPTSLDVEQKILELLLMADKPPVFSKLQRGTHYEFKFKVEINVEEVVDAQRS